MQKPTLKMTAAILAASLAMTAGAACAEGALPRTGTAEFISEWKSMAAKTDMGEGYIVLAGTFWGTSTNNSETGFLHKAVWNCAGSAIGKSGVFDQIEYCVITDADGDKLYGPAIGKVTPETGLVGNVVYEKGTGKYAGIKGGHDFTCKRVGSDGQAFCDSTAEWTFE